jgi:hypothetical protein
MRCAKDSLDLSGLAHHGGITDVTARAREGDHRPRGSRRRNALPALPSPIRAHRRRPATRNRRVRRSRRKARDHAQPVGSAHDLDRALHGLRRHQTRARLSTALRRPRLRRPAAAPPGPARTSAANAPRRSGRRRVRPRRHYGSRSPHDHRPDQSAGPQRATKLQQAHDRSVLGRTEVGHNSTTAGLTGRPPARAAKPG